MRHGPVSALVTGANRGIGLALLQRLAARGPVIGTGRTPPFPEVANAGWVELDVASAAALDRLPLALEQSPLDLLVCNAGIYPDRNESLDTGYPARLWHEVFAVNVTGVFKTIQRMLPHLQAAHAGKIAIISSQMGASVRASGGSYAYRASKAAVLNIGLNLAADLRPRGIAVGIYHPGWVQTDLGGAAGTISAEEAADGLIARFDALSLETSGCFETWDGRPHPV